MADKGVLYMIPCPISDSTEVYDVVPQANSRVLDSLDYFIVGFRCNRVYDRFKIESSSL